MGDAVHTGIRVTLILLTSWNFGQVFLPPHWSSRRKLLIGVTIWMSLLSLVLTAAYYASIPLIEQTQTIIETVLVMSSLIFHTLIHPRETVIEEQKQPVSEILISGSLSVIAIAALVVLIHTFTQHATFLSVQTAWALLPKGTFLLITIPFFAALIAAWRDRTSLVTLITATTSWLTVSVITPLLFPLGYGFDGFIHRASQQVLLDTGSLQPKPLYYIGQYVWTTWLARAFDLPLRGVDIWLVPVGIALPVIAVYIWAKDDRVVSSWRLPFTMLLAPLAVSISTTPQSFAYLLGFSSLISALWTRHEKRSWIVPLLWALWATMVHPLGGLPFLAIVLGLWLADALKPPWAKRTILILSTLGGLLAIPFAFWAQSRVGGTAIVWNWSHLFSASWQTIRDSIQLQPRQTLSLWVDGTEWSSVCFQLFLIIVALFQIAFPKRPAYRTLACMGLGLLGVKWILEHIATFAFLINYEQGNYTERLSILSTFFLVPGGAHWLEDRFAAISERTPFIFCSLLLAFSALWSVHVYDALPRYDAAKASSGYNVSRADVEAVHWIHDQAKGLNYTVLANQTVSGAALETYGFLRYSNDIFYYPLPTGGRLYQSFLKASSVDGTMDDIKKAATETQSKTVFVVIDQYWWNADLVNERLATSANQSISFENGSVWVYRFDVVK